ncbi:MAG: DUF2007 domain-containing protein [Melioribacteraceae bacterium]|jgi:hypothetical protein|nr:hypothetical protein [Ignavibacteriota bacterium]MBZ0182819.1 DUF2007 domain-containing protein [Melioribacteraceae bacterium]
MICPTCEYEYVEGIKVCPDCKTELIPNEDFEGNLTNPDDYVIVYTCSETYEAEMLKANLKGAEIEALVLSQKDRSYPGVGDLSVVKLLVKKDSAQEALEIINDINSSIN